MNHDKDKITELLRLIEQQYPDWQGFADERFAEDEINYKQATIAKARELLSERELRRLIDQGEWDEFIARLEAIGQDNNLLWRNIPMAGDLNILYQAELDRPSFCEAVLDLLFGPGPSHERFGRYVEYVNARQLPNKWTFPTYFLFICHPDTEMFVKPHAATWFVKFIGVLPKLPTHPAPSDYYAIKQAARELRDALGEYKPRDMVDIQSFIWTCYRTGRRLKRLAQPFSQVFGDREEAEWAFDLLEATAERLGIDSANDERFTLSLRYGRRALHFSFGRWLVLGFYGAGLPLGKNISVPLFADQVDLDERFEDYDFAQADDEPAVRGYSLPAEMLKSAESDIHQVYDKTLDYIAQKFQHWKRSPYRKHHVPEIAEAVFDRQQREVLFDDGLSEDALDQAEDSRDEADRWEKTSGFFTDRAFDLLEDIHAHPTRDFYSAHKDEFVTHVEGPFQELMATVARQLPSEITDLLETQRHVFSRFPKNDFGRGGAWDFYWGAFYPKGGKRIADAQLSVWMNRERIEYGFYIGEYGSEQRKRFIRNLQESKSRSKEALGSVLSVSGIPLGSRETRQKDEAFLTVDEWLSATDESDLVSVAKVVSRADVLKQSRDELSEDIRATFAALFPLVLLTVEDDPWPAMGAYLEEVEPSEFVTQPRYSLDDFAAETKFARDQIESWVRRLRRKKHVVFQGPPGTGKTFVAVRLARLMVSETTGFWDVVQFHPAYAYEDFVQGIRPVPTEGGLSYELADGRFLAFCRKAREEASGAPCVLIIDEINRAHLSRVFGELMYLLEYRDKAIPLAAGGKPFQIPDNVYLIGTMNTADRSIALVDHALRRRFSFIRLSPDYEVLRKHLLDHGHAPDACTDLINVLKRVNAAIDDPNYELGISFFMKDGDHVRAVLPDIWRGEIEPYLEEFFYDQPGKVSPFRWDRLIENELGDWVR